MIYIKNKQDIELMRKACELTKEALYEVGVHIKPGITSAELNKIAFDFIKKHGAIPSFLNYNGYPASICCSVNDVVVHGIPSKKVIEDGDIVSIDIGAYLNGFHGDCAKTFMVGNVSDKARKLVEVTRQCFYEGIKYAKAGNRIGDIGNAIQMYASQNGFSVVRDLVGHGIGRDMHEDPSVPNYGEKGRGVRLVKGMTLAIEPMINEGDYKVTTDSDGWTVRTADHSLSSHYENTILITDNEPEILTKIKSS